MAIEISSCIEHLSPNFLEVYCLIYAIPPAYTHHNRYINELSERVVSEWLLSVGFVRLLRRGAMQMDGCPLAYALLDTAKAASNWKAVPNCGAVDKVAGRLICVVS
jgi:hypothetical protein